MPAASPWLRSSALLLLGASVLLFVDSQVTNLIIPARDPATAGFAEDDTVRRWRELVAHGGSPEEARPRLARHHDAARAELQRAAAPRPDGLDPLFAVLLERVDDRVYLEAEPIDVDEASFAAIEVPDAGVRIVPIAEHVRGGGRDCSNGITKAFRQATGGEVVTVLTPDSYDAAPVPESPRLVLAWRASASGTLYGSGDKRLFPGFTVTASMKLVAGDATLATVEATVDPGATIEYTTLGGVPAAFFDGDHADVAGGMIEGACRRLGEELVGEMTGWAPPAQAADAKNDVDECERGEATACVAAGERLRESDPAKALALLEKGCSPSALGGGEACMVAAELSLAHPDDDISPTAKASVLLGQGCDGNYAPACDKAAEVGLMRKPGEEPPSAYGLGEAYLLRLRACDLGFGPSCAAAASQAQTGPTGVGTEASPLRALLLAARACARGGEGFCDIPDALREAAARERTVHGVALEGGDEPFDVRWGMWIESDEAEVVWIASSSSRADLETRLATEIAGHRARVYDPGALPPGPTAPAQARSIYALRREPNRPPHELRRCPECTADAQSPFWPVSCTCLP